MTCIALCACDIGWIGGLADDPFDTCAHGHVLMTIGDARLVSPEDGRLTVSTAAIYLLRTLDTSAPPHRDYAVQTFPCCGVPIAVTSQGAALFNYCPSGVSLDISTVGERVTIRGRDGRDHHVPLAAWWEAVLGFSGQVGAVYAASSAKVIDDAEETAAFETFRREWMLRDPTVSIPAAVMRGSQAPAG